MNKAIQLYQRALAQPLLWHLRTLRGKDELQTLNTFFDGMTRRIVEDLQANGYAMTTFSDLFPNSSFAVLADYAHSLRKRYDTDPAFRQELQVGRETAKKGARKDFLIPLYGGAWTTPVLAVENPFTPFMLDPRVLAVAGSYISVFPRLSAFNLSATRVIPTDDTDRTYSQRWHRDPEDRRILKFFIYLSDVLDDSAGPFMYVRGSHRGGKYERLFPQHPPAGSYPPEGAVEKSVKPDDIISCYGEAGTIIFADTVGLHRGGFSTKKERIMFTAGFVSDGALQRPKYSLADDLDALNPLARRAVCQ